MSINATYYNSDRLDNFHQKFLQMQSTGDGTIQAKFKK